MSSNVCGFLCGVALGAAAMYFLDPQGGRRRALVRDKAYSWANDAAGKTARHLGNVAQGMAHEAGAAVAPRS
jgi:gas vesicle protein